MSIKNHFNARTLAAIAFTSGQVAFLAKNIEGFSASATSAAILLTACSFCYPLSNKNPKWLAVAGTNLIAAYLIIGATADGNGKFLQQLGMITPLIQGALLIKAGLHSSPENTEEPKPSKKSIFARIARIPGKFPIATGAFIEAPGVAAVAVGAFLSQDWYLATAATQWTIGNLLLASSDPAFKAHKSPSNDLKPVHE